MSLNPDDSRRRDRAKSPGRRDERDRSRGGEVRERSRVAIGRAPSPPSSRYADDRDYEQDRRKKYEYEETVTRSSGRPGRDEPRYAESSYRASSPPKRHASFSMPGDFVEDDVKVKYGDRKGKEYYEEKKTIREYSSGSESESPERRPSYAKKDERPSYAKKESYRYDDPDPRDRERERNRDRDRELERELELERMRKSERDLEREREKERDARRYEDEKYEKERGVSFSAKAGSHSMSGGLSLGHGEPRREHRPPSPDLAYGDSPPLPSAARHSYAEPKKWEYAQPEEKISYTTRKESYTGAPGYDRPPYGSARSSQTQVTTTSSYGVSPRTSQQQVISSHGISPHSSQQQVVTVEPGQRRVSGASALAPRMGSSLSLSVSAGHGHGPAPSLALAPGSPLLEAYHGTYQSISPMPSPLMIASHPHISGTDISSLELAAMSAGGRQRHARFHDPVADATNLARALKGNKAPDVEPLIEILPALTHEQVMDLRVEYKKMVKTGSEKKGVNIAKHIKLRLKEEDSSLMKACYAVALGKWESEAYWANFWYQGEKSRRELLIESLMGRTNAEIRAIKDGFSDKKYSDSLTKCMRTELKEDKFKKAILLVLDEKRMDDRPGVPLDRHLIEDDVKDLYKAVRAEKGGETQMIQIIVTRSDNHIREILRIYESTYRANFAREMLKKSGNLVGELLAHILNGVINPPVRDALLLNHALTLTKSDGIRTELLISRLVRYHWDGVHMEAVKREYRSRYGKDLQEAVREGSKGDWGEFCEELCVRRMPDDVRRVERVERIERVERVEPGGRYR